MTFSDLIEHFGSTQAVADALDVSYQSVHQWKRSGKVPQGRQWQLQALTAGKLQADSLFRVDHKTRKSSAVIQ